MVNPFTSDMTGRTTLDHADKAFGALVTRHYQTCVDERAPVYHVVHGVLDDAPYAYARLTLPLSDDGVEVDKLMVSPLRVGEAMAESATGPLGRFWASTGR